MSDTLFQLMTTIGDRKRNPTETSYTTTLFRGGTELIGRKILEEAGEVAVAGNAADTAQGRDALVCEAADLVYHLCVMLGYHNRTWSDVEAELQRRFGMSGLEEKARRAGNET
ncbi:MAG TPA: phosphoribosyl-ATP diphosphatase [Pirellulaceae bacterium]